VKKSALIITPDALPLSSNAVVCKTSGLQFLSGLAHSLGGTDFDNSLNALFSLGTGGMVAKGMRLIAPCRGVTSASQRATTLANSRTRTYIGGTYDVISKVAAELGPQVESCSGHP
jgi:hypothetical protein